MTDVRFELLYMSLVGEDEDFEVRIFEVYVGDETIPALMMRAKTVVPGKVLDPVSAEDFKWFLTMHEPGTDVMYLANGGDVLVTGFPDEDAAFEWAHEAELWLRPVAA